MGGRAEDADGLMKALRGVSIADAPDGPVHFDRYGNAAHNVSIRRVERRKGR